MKHKVIHYCWFGGNKKSKLINKCILSWKKHCPNFEIIEWNETNFDINICDYVREAYNKRKWAFVSDYARFFVLNKYGGVYLDTDVELIQSLDCLKQDNFVGFEKNDSVNTGLIMGCNKNNEMCKDLINEYNKDHFIIGEKINFRTVCERVTDYLVLYGLVLNGKTQHVLDFDIYDKSYFNPYDMETGKVLISENTISVHHYAASWVKKTDRIRGKIYHFLNSCLGNKITKVVRKIFGKRK